jgi:predicted DsbA family dithiol-disulfide isomerase
LIHWAGLEGRQTAAVSSLFRAYFVEGRDIGDLEVLIEIAQTIEMDPEMVRRLFNSDADMSDIQARDANARERGVTGVPTFIIANQHVVAGAQPTELWEQVINDLAAQAKDTDG